MFKIGDLVEIIDAPNIRPKFRQYIGMQAEVMGGLEADALDFYHRIKLANGEQLYATPRILRKIRPKQNWAKLCKLDMREAQMA